MVRGLQYAAAAMTAEQTRQDAIAHNIANAATSGFRRLLVTFEAGDAVNVHRRDGFLQPALGGMSAGPNAPRVVVDTRQGSLGHTGDRTDLAVDGPGFVVGEGGRYVRGGKIAADAQGNLTIGGVRVVGAGPREEPIRASGGQVVVEEDGTVRRATGEVAGRLRLVSIDAGAIAPAGLGIYRALDPRAVRESSAGVLRQGVREQANVNPVEEIVQMIAGMRSYEAAMRVIQTTDESLARAAEQVGKVG